MLLAFCFLTSHKYWVWWDLLIMTILESLSLKFAVSLDYLVRTCLYLLLSTQTLPKCYPWNTTPVRVFSSSGQWIYLYRYSLCLLLSITSHLPDLLVSLPGFPEIVKLLRQVKLKPGLFTFFVFLLCFAIHQEFEVYAANSNFFLCKTKLLAWMLSWVSSFLLSVLPSFLVYNLHYFLLFFNNQLSLFYNRIT